MKRTPEHYDHKSYTICELFAKDGRYTIARNKDGWFTLFCDGEFVQESHSLDELKAVVPTGKTK